MGTRYNRLGEAVLTCNYNLCFEQSKKNINNFYLKILIFYNLKKSLYIIWARFRNVMIIRTTYYMYVTDDMDFNANASVIFFT